METHPYLSNLGVRHLLLSDLITSDGRLGGESDATPGIAVARTNQPPLVGVVTAPSLFVKWKKVKIKTAQSASAAPACVFISLLGLFGQYPLDGWCRMPCVEEEEEVWRRRTPKTKCWRGGLGACLSKKGKVQSPCLNCRGHLGSVFL